MNIGLWAPSEELLAIRDSRTSFKTLKDSYIITVDRSTHSCLDFKGSLEAKIDHRYTLLLRQAGFSANDQDYQWVIKLHDKQIFYSFK